MILAAALGPLLSRLEIALTCAGPGAALTAGLTVRRRWRQHQALTLGGYVPWMQQPSQRRTFARIPGLHAPVAARQITDLSTPVGRRDPGQVEFKWRGMLRLASRAG